MNCNFWQIRSLKFNQYYRPLQYFVEIAHPYQITERHSGLAMIERNETWIEEHFTTKYIVYSSIFFLGA